MKGTKAPPANQRLPLSVKAKKEYPRLGIGRRPLRQNDEEPLPPAMLRELKRRLKDSNDPVRYMLVSEFSRRFVLYYNVSTHMFAMNNPAVGTLFKRRDAAECVKNLLGSGISILKYTTKGSKLKRLSPFRTRYAWRSKRIS